MIWVEMSKTMLFWYLFIIYHHDLWLLYHRFVNISSCMVSNYLVFVGYLWVFYASALFLVILVLDLWLFVNHGLKLWFLIKFFIFTSLMLQLSIFSFIGRYSNFFKSLFVSFILSTSSFLVPLLMHCSRCLTPAWVTRHNAHALGRVLGRALARAQG